MKITRHNGKNQSYTLLIDRCDLALYRRYKWQRHTKGLIRYTGEKKGKGCVLLHREIMGVGPELYVLHRNGDKFDCRRKNLETITFQEQRDRRRVPRRPYFNTRSRTGAVAGVTIQKHVHCWANGKTSTYHCASACFSHQRKVFTKRFSVEVWGEHEAKRRAWEWRVGKIREHSMEPDHESLDKLAQATAEADANPYTRPVKPPKPAKAPNLPRLPRLWMPKPPKVPKAVKPPKPPKLPKVPKPPKASKTARRRPARGRVVNPAARGPESNLSLYRNPINSRSDYAITDLPDGTVAVEHETPQSRQTATVFLDATDLHFYLLRAWMINCDGILCSGLGRNQIRLHRLIIGATPGERVVFRNGDTFDLRRENLVLGGICRNTMGLTAHGVYPFYVKRGKERVLWGVRTVIVLPGNGTAKERRVYRHFSFEKYGEQEAHRRAYTLRIEGLRACGQPIHPDLAAVLERVTNSSDHGNLPVSAQSAGFFRLMSVGGALAK